jgi:hypothetical protein
METHQTTVEIEELLTIREVASLFRLSYDSARSHFKDLPGVLVQSNQSRYKRRYKVYKVPKSLVIAEWQKMATFNSPNISSRSIR